MHIELTDEINRTLDAMGGKYTELPLTDSRLYMMGDSKIVLSGEARKWCQSFADLEQLVKLLYKTHSPIESLFHDHGGSGRVSREIFAPTGRVIPVALKKLETFHRASPIDQFIAQDLLRKHSWAAATPLIATEHRIISTWHTKYKPSIRDYDFRLYAQVFADQINHFRMRGLLNERVVADNVSHNFFVNDTEAFNTPIQQRYIAIDPVR